MAEERVFPPDVRVGCVHSAATAAAFPCGKQGERPEPAQTSLQIDHSRVIHAGTRIGPSVSILQSTHPEVPDTPRAIRLADTPPGPIRSPLMSQAQPGHCGECMSIIFDTIAHAACLGLAFLPEAV